MKPTDYNFPFEEYRQVQLDALEWASQADRQVLMLSAPPGVGKSLIGATWGKMFGGAKGFILTKTLSLLQQYETQLEIPGVRGAANFDCVPVGLNCEDGAEGCPFRRTEGLSYNCPYIEQKAAGLGAPQAVAAYAFALWNTVKRDYLVCDEGHSLLDILTEFESISIPLDLNPPRERERLPAWAEIILPKMEERKPVGSPKELVRWQRTVRALERLKHLDNYPHVMVETSRSLVQAQPSRELLCNQFLGGDLVLRRQHWWDDLPVVVSHSHIDGEPKWRIGAVELAPARFGGTEEGKNAFAPARSLDRVRGQELTVGKPGALHRQE